MDSQGPPPTKWNSPLNQGEELNGLLINQLEVEDKPAELWRRPPAGLTLSLEPDLCSKLRNRRKEEWPEYDLTNNCIGYVKKGKS